MSRRKLFTWSAGEYGGRVRVFEGAHGWLYANVRDAESPVDAPRYRKISLHHRDQDRAKKWAKDEADKLAAGLESIGDGVPTVKRVFTLYLATQTPRKGASCRYQDRRAVKMWTRVLGAGKDLAKFT